MTNTASVKYMMHKELFNMIGSMPCEFLNAGMLYMSLMDQAFVMYKKGEITKEEYEDCEKDYEEVRRNKTNRPTSE